MQRFLPSPGPEHCHTDFRGIQLRQGLEGAQRLPWFAEVTKTVDT